MTARLGSLSSKAITSCRACYIVVRPLDPTAMDSKHHARHVFVDFNIATSLVRVGCFVQPLDVVLYVTAKAFAFLTFLVLKAIRVSLVGA